MTEQHKSYLHWGWEQFKSLAVIILIAFLIRTFGYGLYQVPSGSMETTMLVGERFFADKFTVLFKSIKRGDIISFNDPKYDYSDNIIVNLWQNYIYGPANWTKRVIALPGEEIKGEIEDGRPVVYLKKIGETEFKKLDEPYLNKFPLLAYAGKNTRHPVDYQSWDQSLPLDHQPFYNMTKAGVARGETMAQYYGDVAVKYPNTLYSENGEYKDSFNHKLADDEYWVMGDNRLGSHDSRAWGPLKKHFIHGKIVYRIFSLDSNSGWWILDLLKHPIDFWKSVRWSRCFQSVN